jgi:hypothetical protein
MGEATADVAAGCGCDARFREVGEAFTGNFARGGEVRGAVAVTVGNRLVVDVWAGHADAARPRGAAPVIGSQWRQHHWLKR